MFVLSFILEYRVGEGTKGLTADVKFAYFLAITFLAAASIAAALSPYLSIS